jgi:hypothetical protein
LAGALDGGFTDSQTAGDLSQGEALEEPASDKQLLASVEPARAAGRGTVNEAIEAVLLVVSFPAALRGDGVTEGPGQLLLGGQFALPEHDTDEAEVGDVVEGDAINRLVPAEDNAVAVVVGEPQAWGNERAGVGQRVRWERQHGLRV